MGEETHGPGERRAGWSYCGEAWTGADGRARVALPPAARVRSPGFAYELVAADPHVAAELVEELLDGSFVLATDRPHSKVEWRLTELDQPTSIRTRGGTP